MIKMTIFGVLIVDGAARTCCCCECNPQPQSCIVEFLDFAIPSLSNNTNIGCGDSPACASWTGTYVLDYMADSNGCYYMLDEGLPCGASYMRMNILKGGADGTFRSVLTISWPSGEWTTITYTHNNIIPLSKDCITNGTRDNEGVANCVITVASSTNSPCKFELAPTHGNSLVLSFI